MNILQSHLFAPSFSSKINFVTKKELLERFKKNEIGAPWTVEQTVIGEEEAFSRGASICQIGGLTNTKKMMFFHINSCMSDFLPLEDLFIRQTGAVETGEAGVNGLMGGGMPKNLSIRMFKKIYNTMRSRAKDNLSVIWGQCDNRKTHVGYNLKEDTWYINCENTSFDKDAISSVEDINKTYSLIHICDKDEVYLNGKKIDKSELNQCSFEEIEEDAILPLP